MHHALKALLIFLLNRRYIGGKHAPEKQLLKAKTRLIPKEEQRAFEHAYKSMINESFILREKKRTGKSYDWHISLNSKKLRELYEQLEESEDEISRRIL